MLELIKQELGRREERKREFRKSVLEELVFDRAAPRLRTRSCLD